MKAKPKNQGVKYRHLMARGGAIYYQRQVGDQRVRFSLNTTDWDEAAKGRDLYEARRGIGRLPAPVLDVPRFGELAARYLGEDTVGLAPTTLEDRKKLLGKEGLLTRYFDQRRVDEIRRADLVTWWHEQVEKRQRKEKTGRNYLDSLSAVFNFALDLDLIEANPVTVFKATRRRKRGTRSARMAAQPEPHPIESPEEIERLIARARLRSLDWWAIVLLGIDAGLRLGESLALRWRCVDWERRVLHVCESRSRGGAATATKNGKAREVQLSRRLGQALREVYIARGRPDVAAAVLPGELVPAKAFYREWDKVLILAELPTQKPGRHTPHCLRDTFCSWLLSLGFPSAYLVTQTGHTSGTQTLERHYARWVHAGYVEPPRLGPDEVPADLLARLSYPTVTPVAGRSAAPKIGETSA